MGVDLEAEFGGEEGEEGEEGGCGGWGLEFHDIMLMMVCCVLHIGEMERR